MCNDLENLTRRDVIELFNSIVQFEELTDVPIGNTFCPFHNNYHSPAARFYYDEEENRTVLWCFTEKKKFSAYDYYTKVLNKDPTETIKQKFSTSELASALDLLELRRGDSTSLEELERDIKNTWASSGEEVIGFLDNLYLGV